MRKSKLLSKGEADTLKAAFAAAAGVGSLAAVHHAMKTAKPSHGRTDEVYEEKQHLLGLLAWEMKLRGEVMFRQLQL